ncbi:MAG: cysteine dioxygenase family protein [Bacteroidales bacterium]|nr:cysteine dioxygenase family protein [Bacteroidales bacterium]
MKQLLEALRRLEGKTIEPALVMQTLSGINLKQLTYDEYLEGYDVNTYNRIKINDTPLQVFLMTWPPQFFLPIHQHRNFWGYVVPLKGLISETIYGYAARKKKVYLHPTKTHKPGEIIYEPFNVIHKLQNTSPLESSVSIHIYYPPLYNYSGTMIFDAQNRKLAVLNAKATVLSWELPADHYDEVIEDAYDVEKLW